MAEILDPQLSFPSGTIGSGLVDVQIQCVIRWTSEELAIRPSFNLEIYLWGDDGRRGDDNLRAQIFHPELLDNPITPSTSPTTTFNETFSIRGSILNEDDGWANKQDEIYARLRLIPENIASATANTNIATGRFA